jgi:hypothetical protein
MIDHDFMILTKFVSQFLDFYTILYRMYKFSSETNLEKHLEMEKGQRQLDRPSNPMRPARGDRTPLGRPNNSPAIRPKAESSVGAGSFAKESSFSFLFAKLLIVLFIWVMHFTSETLDIFEFFFSKVLG